MLICARERRGAAFCRLLAAEASHAVCCFKTEGTRVKIMKTLEQKEGRQCLASGSDGSEAMAETPGMCGLTLQVGLGLTRVLAEARE